VPRPQRPQLVLELLSDPARRPAIVYAPTRKEAEELALGLSRLFPAAAYHAGLESKQREHVQGAFVEGKLEAVVATIAFGMGIDKPNVRTILRTALPASIEAYYQEIGRAGRDGLPSRAILMHSYADIRLQEYFLDQDYAPIETLEAIYHRLSPQPQSKEDLCRALRMDPELFNRALDKLTVHGGAAIEGAESVALDSEDWRQSYLTQLERKRAQLALMRRYAEAHQCRMRALVRHFGDFADAKRACGQCDFCAPKECIAQRFRPLTQAEQRVLYKVTNALRRVNFQSVGRLHQALSGSEPLNRDHLEGLVGAMAAAGLVLLEDASFEKDGRTVLYRKVTLTREGFSLNEHTPLDLLLPTNRAGEWEPPKRKGRKSPRSKQPPAVTFSVEEAAPQKKSPPQGPPRGPETFSSQEAALEKKLRAWRTAEARKIGLPPYFVFSDRTLLAIVLGRPATPRDLLEINGIGPAKAEKYGESILRICRSRDDET